MADNVSEQSKSGVIMDAAELATWRDGYDQEDQDNAQGWAHEDQLNQLKRHKEEKPMTDEQFNNRGSLWPQEKKHEKAPDYKGKALIDGKEKVVSLWKNTTKTGKQYLGLTYEDPQDRAEKPYTPQEVDEKWDI
jgi:poly(3-hydroxybutyrate) depolymerase